MDAKKKKCTKICRTIPRADLLQEERGMSDKRKQLYSMQYDYSKGYPEYSTYGYRRHAWLAIMFCCYNVKNPGYKYLGAQGIRVCGGWQYYHKWCYDLGPRPAEAYPGSGRAKYGFSRPDKKSHFSCGDCSECLEKGWKRNGEWRNTEQRRQNQLKLIRRHKRPKVDRQITTRTSLLSFLNEHQIDIINFLGQLSPTDKIVLEKRLQGLKLREINEYIDGHPGIYYVHRRIDYIKKQVFSLSGKERTYDEIMSIKEAQAHSR